MNNPLVQAGRVSASCDGVMAQHPALPGPKRSRDRIATAVLAIPSVAVLGLAGVMLSTLISRSDTVLFGLQGWAALVEFLTAAPLHGGREGGIGSILAATFWVLGIALAACVPVGLPVAIGLAEWFSQNSVVGRVVSFALDVIAALPSIVVGMFGLTFFCEVLGLGWSVLSGGLTVATMVLPLFVRVAQEGIAAVPRDLRLAGAALGLPPARIILNIVLPAAAPTIGGGLLLASGRVLAESAALMFTAGGSIRMPDQLLDPGRVLALHIFQLVMEVPGGEPRACASALVLVVVISITAWVARTLPRRWA